ncbi:MAG TPA: 5-oxoprolinase subunit PxpA [Candidatus Limnocylindria bacterium]|nr:5-oxoprolinase subunit PxpA [Candidatus Limnocylindria bacterium]
MRAIDLNADLGEGMTTDAAVMASITSANIACGAHAGDIDTMSRTIALAREKGVAVGAHPGYADRDTFGRKPLKLDDAELVNAVADQIGLLRDVAAKAGVPVGYVKAHGALYNQGEKDERIAGLLADAITSVDRTLVLVCTPTSAMARVAKARGIRVAREGFCDRRYEPDGSLRARSKAGALITDPYDAATQALWLAQRGDVDTLCVHGDTPDAPAIARRVRAMLEDAGFDLRPFA